MRVLQISADRSKRGILFPGSDAFKRQEAYAKQFGNLDIVAFSLKRDGAKIIESGALRILPTNSFSKIMMLWDALKIARTLPKPDVVSAQDPFETGLIASRITRHFNVPLHIQVHTDFLSRAYVKRLAFNKIRVAAAGFVLRRARRIRVVSQRIKLSIEKRYGLAAEIFVLPIFVDVEKFRNTKVDSDVAARFSSFAMKLLVVSRLEKEKNVELAIEAFAARAPRNACLIIVGDGSARNRLRAISRAVHISDRIFFEGQKEPAPYYALADLVLVPSKYEGYGLVIIEALAAGKPVLSTDVGIARESGAIVASESDFAQAIEQWFKNGPREMHLQAYPYANFEDYVQKYCADIETCVAR